MLFNIVRIALLLLALIVAALIIGKSNYRNKKKNLICISVLCTVFVFVSGIFPVENFFVNYKSPESVFKYTKNGTVYDIINGNESALVIYREINGTYSHYIVPKNADGYKIPTAFSERKVLHKIDHNGVFDIYNANDTDDYYVFGAVNFGDNDKEISVYDSNDKKIECAVTRVESTNFIFFFLNDFSDDYYLVINGERLMLSAKD